MTWFVYGLRDPRTEAIRYVGKSSAPRSRFLSHTSKFAAQGVRVWVDRLAETGLQPELCTLGEFETEEAALEAERSVIATLAQGGAKLLNSRLGGESSRGKGRCPFPGIGERLRRRRLEIGISQLRLAKTTGVPDSTINRLESGKHDDCAASTAVLLARALGCSTEWLVTGEPSEGRAVA